MKILNEVMYQPQDSPTKGSSSLAEKLFKTYQASTNLLKKIGHQVKVALSSVDTYIKDASKEQVDFLFSVTSVSSDLLYKNIKQFTDALVEFSDISAEEFQHEEATSDNELALDVPFNKIMQNQISAMGFSCSFSLDMPISIAVNWMNTEGVRRFSAISFTPFQDIVKLLSRNGFISQEDGQEAIKYSSKSATPATSKTVSQDTESNERVILRGVCNLPSSIMDKVSIPVLYKKAEASWDLGQYEDLSVFIAFLREYILECVKRGSKSKL